MMTEHCMVNGVRCSKCCEVITMFMSKNHRDWRRYVRWYGYPTEFTGSRVFHLFRVVSKRRAKKINPRLVSIVGNNQSYFTCKNFTGSGCSDYENRPDTCSKYPYYGRTKEQTMSESNEPLYDVNCTYFIELS